MLNIDKTHENGCTFVALKGRLDTTTAPELESTLIDCLKDTSVLTLDLEKLEYISSAGLRVLLVAQKTMNVQGEMKLTHVGTAIMDIFEVTGFSEILTIE